MLCTHLPVHLWHVLDFFKFKSNCGISVRTVRSVGHVSSSYCDVWTEAGVRIVLFFLRKALTQCSSLCVGVVRVRKKCLEGATRACKKRK